MDDPWENQDQEDDVPKTVPPLKRGPKSGSSNTSSKKTVDDWAIACQKFRAMPGNTARGAQKSFLESSESGPKFSGTQSERVSFGKKLKEFDAGKLVPGAQAKDWANIH